MTFPTIDFLAFVFIPLSLFFLFGWLIFYHLTRYGIKGDSSKNISYFFLIVLIIISISIIIIFFTIDWNSFNIQDFIYKPSVNL